MQLTMIRPYKFLPALIFLTSCGATQPSTVPANIASIDSGRTANHREAGARAAVAVDFLRALLSKDMATLKKYGSGPNEFFDPDGRMTETYNQIYVSHPEYGGRSMLDIARNQYLHIGIIGQDKSDVFTAIYTPLRNKNMLGDIDFLENKWGIEYFACEFIKSGSTYILYQNMCFAETDGPFGGDYG